MNIFQPQPLSATQSVGLTGASQEVTFVAGGYPQYGGVIWVNFQGTGMAFVKLGGATGVATVADTPVQPGVPVAIPIGNYGGPAGIFVDVIGANTPTGTVYLTPGVVGRAPF